MLSSNKFKTRQNSRKSGGYNGQDDLTQIMKQISSMLHSPEVYKIYLWTKLYLKISYHGLKCSSAETESLVLGANQKLFSVNWHDQSSLFAAVTARRPDGKQGKYFLKVWEPEP